MAFSLLPLLSRSNWWDAWDYPTSIMDQNFGMGLLDSDLLPPRHYHGYILRPRTQSSISSSGQSEVKNDPDKFQVMLNVSHFKPEEINVKTVDNSVVIHGKHEEKCDEHGFICREFTRRYMLPEGTEPSTVKSSLSQNGVLVIEAPKKAIEPPPNNERVVPITIQKPEELIIARFNNMKTTFQKNIKKYKELKRCAGAENFIVSWVHFKSMLFLEDSVEIKESFSNLDSPLESQKSKLTFHEELNLEDETSFENQEGSVDSPQSTICQYSTSSEEEVIDITPMNKEDTRKDLSGSVTSKSKKDIKSETKDVVVLNKVCRILDYLGNKKDSPEDLFGMFIAAKLKEIKSIELRNKAQLELTKVLFEYLQ